MNESGQKILQVPVLDKFDNHWLELCQKDLVSIIIPTRNRQDYLAESLRSILNQLYSRIEIIVINDGSTDATESVVEKWKAIFKGQRGWILNSVQFERTQGPSSARNAGLFLSRGEYISFLDDDDLYHPEKISEQVKSLRSLGADTVFGSYANFTDVQSDDFSQARLILKDEVNPGIDGAISWLLHPKAFCSLPTALLKRSLFSQVGGFDNTLRYHEDYELIFRLIIGGATIRRCPSSIYYRRIRSSSISGFGKNQIEFFAKSWSKMLQYFEDAAQEKGVLENYRKPLAQRWGVVAITYLMSGNKNNAGNCIIHIHQLDPTYRPSFPPHYSGQIMKMLYAVGGFKLCSKYKKLRFFISRLLKRRNPLARRD